MKMLLCVSGYVKLYNYEASKYKEGDYYSDTIGNIVDITDLRNRKFKTIQDEAKYRLSIKRQLYKKGIPYNKDDTTENLVILYRKNL